MEVTDEMIGLSSWPEKSKTVKSPVGKRSYRQGKDIRDSKEMGPPHQNSASLFK